jgi:hypothetical protein
VVEGNDGSVHGYAGDVGLGVVGEVLCWVFGVGVDGVGVRMVDIHSRIVRGRIRLGIFKKGKNGMQYNLCCLDGGSAGAGPVMVVFTKWVYSRVGAR